jgi:hypothetical protein
MGTNVISAEPSQYKFLDKLRYALQLRGKPAAEMDRWVRQGKRIPDSMN